MGSEPQEPEEAPLSPARRALGWVREIALTLAFGAALLVGVGWLRSPDLPASAPDFSLATLDGSRVALSGLRGQTVVLNFWATWCGPCRIELPTLVDFAADHPDIPVLYVAVDGEPEALRRFASEHDMPLKDVLVADQATYRAYGVSTIPMTVVVGPEGEISGIHAGILLRPLLWWMTR